VTIDEEETVRFPVVVWVLVGCADDAVDVGESWPKSM
jgi:hypothetical protein